MSKGRVIGDSHVTRLEGHLDEQAFLSVSGPILQMARVDRSRLHVLDCAGLTGLDGRALVRLSQLISEVRRLGSDVILLNFSKRIQETMIDRMAEAMLHPTLVEPVKELLQAVRTNTRGHAWRGSSVN